MTYGLVGGLIIVFLGEIVGADRRDPKNIVDIRHGLILPARYNAPGGADGLLLEVLSDVGLGVLVVATLTSQAGASSTIDLLLGHLILAIYGESLVNEWEPGGINFDTDFVAREQYNEVFGFAFQLECSLKNTGVFSPESKVYGGVSLAKS